MKILQINVTVNSGSTGRITEQIGALAIEKGFTSFVAYSRKTKGSISEEVKDRKPTRYLLARSKIQEYLIRMVLCLKK